MRARRHDTSLPTAPTSEPTPGLSLWQEAASRKPASDGRRRSFVLLVGPPLRVGGRSDGVNIPPPNQESCCRGLRRLARSAFQTHKKKSVGRKNRFTPYNNPNRTPFSFSLSGLGILCVTSSSCSVSVVRHRDDHSANHASPRVAHSALAPNLCANDARQRRRQSCSAEADADEHHPVHVPVVTSRAGQ